MWKVVLKFYYETCGGCSNAFKNWLQIFSKKLMEMSLKMKFVYMIIVKKDFRIIRMLF